MSDVNANINISINSQQALGQLRALQNQISTFNQSVIAGNVAAVTAQRDMTRNLTAQINATKGFTTSIANVESSVSRLGRAIDKNKLSLREYFRYGVASSGVMGKSMREHADIMQLAGERVKRLQTQYIALEQAHNGYTRSLAVRPTNLFNADSAIAIQRQQIFNKLLGDGSTALVNWGKNTQWAGRQLMVGFTVPLTIFGGMAGKIFMDLEKQVVQFKRVYGDLQTPTSERNAMVEQVKSLAKEFTKYGIAVSDTVALAAKAAATGAQGEDLLAATTEATRLATLGQIDYQQALDATISLQTALGISSGELAEATDFLNAVENQTVTSLDDITQAIPLVAPVVKGLGGDVKDLAIFMTAMREGGISANEGANALKSGLASLINPTRGAKEQLEKVGINIDSILSKNKGDLRGLVMEFGEALGTLGKFERQQTLAKMFGKYQFSRMGALFSNISKEGSQAARVMDLTAMSAQELGQIAEGELAQLEESVGVKFTAAVEKLKLAIAPIGEAFLKIATPIIDFAAKVADAFNNLPDAAKTFITWGTAIGGVLIPTVIMLVGLLGNFAGNMLKIGAAIGRLMGKTNGLSSGLEYLTGEELDAMAASASLEKQTNDLTGALNVQRQAVSRLAGAYSNYVGAAGAAAASLPQGFRSAAPRRMARGGIVSGSGNGDTVPALLTPGESVINKDATKKFGPILSAINNGSIGRFALGGINIGNGENVQLDLRSFATSSATIRSLLEVAENTSEEMGAAFKDILRNVEQAQADMAAQGERIKSATLGDIKKAVVETGNQDLIRSLYRDDIRYNASSAGVRGTVAQGIMGNVQSGLMTADQAEAEVRRVSAASEGAQRAINEYYDGLVQDVNLDEQQRQRLEAARRGALADAEQQHRAHTVQVSNFEKMFAGSWDARLWMGQAGSENQLSNILAQSDQTRTLYESHLREMVSDTAQADEIMRKINANIALTEEELQTQAQVLRRMLGSTSTMAQVAPKFAGAAVGTVGAAEARASLPPGFFTADTAELRAQAERVALQARDESIAAWRRTWRIASPSELGADTSEEIPRGVAVGIERATPVATAAARTMAGAVGTELRQELNAQVQAAETQVASGLSGIASQMSAYKGGFVFGAGGPSEPLDPKKRATKDVPTGRSPRVRTAGLDYDEFYETSGARERSDKKSGDGPERESGKFKGKLIAGSMALDGLIFGLTMMDGAVGEFAQKIMPAAFAIQGIAMTVSMLGAPLALLLGGVAAVGAGLWYINDQMNDVRQAGRDMAEAMTASAGQIKGMTEFFGTKDLGATKQAKALGTTEKQLSQSQEFLATDAGKQMADGLGIAMEQMGAGPATKQFANKLGEMMMRGVIDMKQAKGIAAALEQQLGIKGLSADIQGNLKSIVGSDGKNILRHPIKVAVQLQEQNSKFVQGLGVSVNEAVKTATNIAVTGAEAGNKSVMDASMEDVGNMFTGAWANMANMDIPYVSDVFSNLTGLVNEDWNKAIAQANAYGTAIGTTLANGYQTASAAAQRYNELEKAANEERDPQKQKEMLKNLEKEKEFLDELDNVGKKNRHSAVAQFALASGTKMQDEMLKSQTASLEQQFADSPLKPFYDAVMGRANNLEGYMKWNLQLSLASGQISPAAMENIFQAFGDDKKAAAQMEMIVSQEGERETGELLNQLMGIEDKDLVREVVVRYPSLNQKAQKSLIDGLEQINALPDNIKKNINVSNTDPVSIIRLGNVMREFDKLPKKLTKKRAVDFINTNFKEVKFGADWFAKLPASVRKSFIAEYTIMFNEVGGLSAAGWDAYNREFGGGAGSRGSSGAPLGLSAEDSAARLAQEKRREADARAARLKRKSGSGETEQTGTEEPSGGGSDGGGGDKENPYGDWWKSLNERLKTFTDINKVMADLKKEKNKFEKALPELQYKGSLVDQMRKAGLSEMMIADLLSKGYDVAKDIFDKLKKKGKLKVADLGFTIAGVADVTQQLVGQNRTNRKTLAAKKNLAAEGLDAEVIDKILESEYAVELYSKSVNSNTKAWQDNINAAKSVVASNKDLEDSTKTVQDVLDETTSLIDEAFSALENQINLNYEKAVKPFEDQLSINKDLIDVYQDQIDAKEELIDDQQRLNELDQQAIEGYNRDIEMQNRKIEGLRREDEIRQRTADALQKELDLMSRAEQAIRDAYQKRISALDTVSKLNDRILQSQQDQLNIGKALSEGDVYAAAQAAAEMQRNSVQYASEQARSALDQGMQNEIDSLRTSSGLSRVQAEEQIRAIQDQAYQTQLAVRDIEDYIYNLKQTKILPLEDAIYARTLTIRDLQNEIYDINENSIEPLEIKNKDLEDQIRSQERIRDLALEEMVIGEFTKAAWEQRKNELSLATTQAELNALALGGIEQKYKDIAAAARDAATQIAKIPGASAPAAATGSATGTSTSFASQAASMGIENPFGFAWVTASNGGRVMKYAAGSVVGNGSRDSISAMLTPGEYVIRKSMVDKYGLPLFEDINQGSFSMPKYGGFGKKASNISGGGKTNVDATIAPVYNTYSVNVNASTNASPDDIANTVINKIRSIESMSIRRVNGY